LEGETAWVVGAVGTDVIRGTQYADQEAKPRNSNAERECIDEISPESLRGKKGQFKRGWKDGTVVVVRRG
jgi:hypothetical protein